MDEKTQQTGNMEKEISMNAGQGEYSYAQNSAIWQKNILLSAKPLLEESIGSWKNTFNCQTLRIADLGCSSGPNTLLITEIITKAIRNKYVEKGMNIPEFQVFYNDLPSNDFNTLFKLLIAVPPLERSFNLVAGVPGSFYTRLFPRNSLHFIHSSNSLHWLSQAPPEVGDKNSECWNRGRICILDQGPAGVVNAYFAQFQRDFNAFLKARAKEVVVGGRMFVVVVGRPSTDNGKQAYLFLEMLGLAMNELVSQGVIEEEKLDSFNLPLYFPTPDEMRSEVLRESSFTVVGLEILTGWLSKVDSHYHADKEAYARLLSKQTRAIFEKVISNHFGEGVINALFHTYATLLANKMDEILEGSEQSKPMMALTVERSCI